MRPGSGRPCGAWRERPVLKNSPPVKLGPLWQFVQSPLPTKILSPRSAGSEKFQFEGSGRTVVRRRAPVTRRALASPPAHGGRASVAGFAPTRLSAPPSQPNQCVERRFMSVGVLRSTSTSPTPRRRLSVQLRSGAWQLPQGQLPVARKALVEEQAQPELDRFEVARSAVGGVALRRQRPGAVCQDARDFACSQCDRRFRRKG